MNQLKVSYAPLIILLLIFEIPFFFGVELSRNGQLFWGMCLGFVCYRAGIAAQRASDNVRIEMLLKINETLLLNNRLREEGESRQKNED